MALVDTGGGVRRERPFSILCASGLEFEKKLRRATVEQANAQRSLNSGLYQNGSKRFEDASERYNRSLSDFMNHKRVCSLCRGSQPGR